MLELGDVMDGRNIPPLQTGCTLLVSHTHDLFNIKMSTSVSMIQQLLAVTEAEAKTQHYWGRKFNEFMLEVQRSESPLF